MIARTSCPISWRCVCPGTNWVNEFAIAMIGLPKCSSRIPVARHRLRAPAMRRPRVLVVLRSGIFMTKRWIRIGNYARMARFPKDVRRTENPSTSLTRKSGPNQSAGGAITNQEKQIMMPATVRTAATVG